MVTTVICKGCGATVHEGRYDPCDVLDNTIQLRGVAEETLQSLQASIDKWYSDVAKRMMESA